MSADRSSDAFAHGFDFLHDPVIVVTVPGDIVEMNASARALFGARLADGKLATLIDCEVGKCTQYLNLASRSTAPRPGKFVFATAQGARPLRTQAARSRQKADPARVILQLMPTGSDRFALLDRRVKDLDAKLLQRCQENAALREALAQNEALLREVQHRVKNNIQQMMAMIRLSAGDHTDPHVSQVVKTAYGRLNAMAAVQEALYQSNAFDVVPGQDVLRRIVFAAARTNGASDAISLNLGDVLLTREESHCLALIANELVTNAARHGLPNGRGRIDVTLADEDGGCVLEIADTGPGIPERNSSRASGLAMVRNLCRQIRGRLDITNGRNGATCTVHFRPERQQKDVP